MIYFDNAATTGKKPQGVLKAVEDAIKFLSANPGRSGHELSAKTAEKIFTVRQKTADFFGASGPENVVFTLNCTHSINCVLKGVLNKGDHVIVSSLEHNAVMRPLKKMKISFDVAKVSLENDDETVMEFAKKIRPNTKLILTMGASNVLGKILPVKRIGELCRKRGILFAVDAAQSAGVIPINMKEMGIDYLCIASHKGLYAPMGTGILICEKPIENTLIEGGTGTNSIELFQPRFLPERLESGTVNVSGIMGIGAGIDYVSTIGLERLYNHEMMLTEILYEGLKKNPEILLYTKEPKRHSYAPVLSFNFKGVPSEKTAMALSDAGVAVRGGLHCSPMAHKQIGTLETGCVRVSFATFNTETEVKKFLSIISDKNLLKNLKKDIE